MNKGPGFRSGLYGLVDDQLRPDVPLPQKVQWLLAAGVGVIQLRLKTTLEREAIPLIRLAVESARARTTPLLVNDRVDWALLCGADGVHLGADDVPVKVARTILGPDAIIGATARGAAQVTAAHAAGANYVGVGPVFASTTKRGTSAPLLLDGFGAIAAASPLPVVAISGLLAEHLASLRRRGAYAAAVGAALWSADDVTATAKAFDDAFRAE
jgi:thiamine-phosphate pyrophosphorylase